MNDLRLVHYFDRLRKVERLEGNVTDPYITINDDLGGHTNDRQVLIAVTDLFNEFLPGQGPQGGTVRTYGSLADAIADLANLEDGNTVVIRGGAHEGVYSAMPTGPDVDNNYVIGTGGPLVLKLLGTTDWTDLRNVPAGLSNLPSDTNAELQLLRDGKADVSNVLLLDRPDSEVYVPTGPYQPATKRYVDDLVASLPPPGDPGTGDMLRSVYDTGGNGVVDDSERLGGALPAFYLDRANHTGPISVTVGDITDLQEALNGKADAAHVHAIADVTGLTSALDGKSNVGHPHQISDVEGLGEALLRIGAIDDTNSSVSTTYSSQRIDSLLLGRAAAVHVHTVADVTGLQAALDGKLAAYPGAGPSALTVDNTSLYVPTEQYHPATKGYVDSVVIASGGGDMLRSVYDADLDGTVDDSSALEGQGGAHYLSRANHTGEQAVSTVTGLQAALDSKANLGQVLTRGNTDTYVPSAPFHPATKRYADGQARSMGAVRYTLPGPSYTLPHTPLGEVLAIYGDGEFAAIVPTGATVTLPRALVTGEAVVFSYIRANI